MKMLHPGQIIQKMKAERREKEEALETFARRLDQALSCKNREELQRLTLSLKNHGITAVIFKNIVETAARNVDFFLRHEVRIIKGDPTLDSKTKTFADVTERSFFMKIAVVLRELYAEDIAPAMSYEDAFRVIIEKFLFHP